MTKEVTKKEETQVANLNDFDWGVEAEARNIVIPKIMLMQGLSEPVTDGKAKLGDLMNSLTKQVVGGIGQATTLIPFYVSEFWYVYKVTGADSDEFLRVDVLNSSNANLPYQDSEDGSPIKRSRIMQVYCLDPNDMAIPVICTFKGTSYKIGKEVYTLMYCLNKNAGKFPPSYTILLEAVKDKNDRGTFAKLKFEKGRETTMEELNVCAQWIETIKAGKAKVDEADIQKNSDDGNSNF